MEYRIAGSACAFGLLLAVAMVCATSAESPRPETPNANPPVQNVPYIAPAPVYPKAPAGSAYSPTGKGPDAPRAIGLSPNAGDRDANTGSSSDCENDKLNHLLKAAEHLEAAGMAEEAKELRKKSDQLKRGLNEALLQRRLVELQKLQSEVDVLRAATGRQNQILIHVQAVEISLDKLRDLNNGAKHLPSGLTAKLIDFILNDADDGTSTVLDSTAAKQTVAALCEAKVARVLAEPSLVTVDGRPGYFHSGGQVAFQVRNADGSAETRTENYGTQFNVVAKMLGGRRVRMEIKPKISELDPKPQVMPDGSTVTRMSVREIDTAIEMELGKTAFIGGAVSNNFTNVGSDPTTGNLTAVLQSSVQTVFLVTPELIEGHTTNRSQGGYYGSAASAADSGGAAEPTDASHNNKKLHPEPPREAIASAWQRAGAEVGWIRLDRFAFEAHRPADSNEGEVPAFKLRHLNSGDIGELPKPTFPFGVDLSDTHVTDSDLQQLAAFEHLRILIVGDGSVTDEGLGRLTKLSGLRVLILGDTHVTDSGLFGLQTKLPKCQILH